MSGKTAISNQLEPFHDKAWRNQLTHVLTDIAFVGAVREPPALWPFKIYLSATRWWRWGLFRANPFSNTVYMDHLRSTQASNPCRRP